MQETPTFTSVGSGHVGGGGGDAASTPQSGSPMSGHDHAPPTHVHVRKPSLPPPHVTMGMAEEHPSSDEVEQLAPATMVDAAGQSPEPGQDDPSHICAGAMVADLPPHAQTATRDTPRKDAARSRMLALIQVVGHAILRDLPANHGRTCATPCHALGSSGATVATVAKVGQA
jgi:hypothetical protein